MAKTYDEAHELFLKYNKGDSLIKHGYTVETVMRHFARLNGEDEEKWAIVGLLHDLDYEMYPQEHCIKTREILEENGYDEEIIRAVVSHSYGFDGNDTEPISQMEKTLYAVDELSGLVNACALMRPTLIEGMTPKSVKKKFGSLNFAAGVDREVVKKGAEMLNMELSDITREVIAAMEADKERLGLAAEK